MSLRVALAAGLAGGLIGACAARAPTPSATWQLDQQRRDEVTALWTQIRDWRREARMDLEPMPSAVMAMASRSVASAGAVCPDAYVPPTACDDVCGLADAICEDAEAICDIAAELAPDPWADGKCDSAKASCHEAKARCCGCEAPALAPTAVVP